MKSPDRLAAAFDLGTTTIAASLLDLGRGVRLAAAGALNPQREFGADVVSRLAAACESPDALGRMARLLNEELERLTGELLGSAGAAPASLTVVAIAGNPAMEHLLLGLPVASLAFPPYRPLFTAGKSMNSVELGWQTAVDAYLFPLPGGFVGGDLVAFLHGVGVTSHQLPVTSHRLFLDLGTNGELALSAGERIYATSAAAGPAFEGGNLECGMAALPGAISGVSFAGDRLGLTVIGGGTPAGICGSGVIETVAGLLRGGILDATGRLLSAGEIPSNLANRLISRDGEPAFLLYRDARTEVFLSQRDIRQVQLAKAAIRAGMEVLCERAGIHWEALREVVLTGSFGARLSPEQLKNVGIFPEKMVDMCSFVRDGALAGVEHAVCTPGGFGAVESLSAALRVVPLSGTPAFEKHFLEQMNFPEIKN
ncbi:MAG: ASKHA domain-containing protein [Geobacteraceae bacterium]|nr:ASKHA domain-containing protein [Geobacteraceae bacterium]